jgi:hypothetical protein
MLLRNVQAEVGQLSQEAKVQPRDTRGGESTSAYKLSKAPCRKKLHLFWLLRSEYSICHGQRDRLDPSCRNINTGSQI